MPLEREAAGAEGVRAGVDVAVGQELAPPGAADGTFDAPADIKPS